MRGVFVALVAARASLKDVGGHWRHLEEMLSSARTSSGCDAVLAVLGSLLGWFSHEGPWELGDAEDLRKAPAPP
eukprot:7878399-Pyramimonas_sp.AAC.1